MLRRLCVLNISWDAFLTHSGRISLAPPVSESHRKELFNLPWSCSIHEKGRGFNLPGHCSKHEKGGGFNLPWSCSKHRKKGDFNLTWSSSKQEKWVDFNLPSSCSKHQKGEVLTYRGLVTYTKKAEAFYIHEKGGGFNLPWPCSKQEKGGGFNLPWSCSKHGKSGGFNLS